MSNGSVGSVTIAGQTYYFSDKAKYDEVRKLSGDIDAQKQLIIDYQRRYGTSVVSTDENDLVVFDEGSEDDGDAGKTEVDIFDYNNWLVNNGLSGASKLSADSKLEDIAQYYNQIANNLNSIMSSIDSALSSKDPETIDAYMQELTFNMAALDGISQQSGFGSLVPEEYQAYLAIGGLSAATAAGTAAAMGITGTLATIAGVSVSVPVAGWIVAGVCGLAALGVGIYNYAKQKEIDEFKEQMQQTMDDCISKKEYAQKEIGEITEDIAKEAEREINKIDGGFDKIKSVDDVANNIASIVEYQAQMEQWAELCEKYGIEFKGQDLLDKLGSGDEKTKYADEYVEKFVEHTKNAIESSGNVVDDTGSYIASADDITALISALESNQATADINLKPLQDLIQFIKEKNQEDVNNDVSSISDGMYTGGSSGGGSYTSGMDGYSGALDAAGENKTGVDGAAADGKYDVNTEDYEKVQAEAKEKAQNDIDEYLKGIDISGKTIEELEDLYNLTSSDLELFKSYQENLDLDLSEFDTVLADIREQQQTLLDDYANSITTSGKSLEELEALYDEVGAQYDTYKSVSSTLDMGKVDEKLLQIRADEQKIVDEKVQEFSSKIQSTDSIQELSSIQAEAAQYLDSISSYEVDSTGVNAINVQMQQKIQSIADEKTMSYTAQANAVATSDEANNLANSINLEIANMANPNVDTSALQQLAIDLTAKSSELRLEEVRKQEEEAARRLAEKENNGKNNNTLAELDAYTPMIIPAAPNDGVPAYSPEEFENGEPAEEDAANLILAGDSSAAEGSPDNGATGEIPEGTEGVLVLGGESGPEAGAAEGVEGTEGSTSVIPGSQEGAETIEGADPENVSGILEGAGEAGGTGEAGEADGEGIPEGDVGAGNTGAADGAAGEIPEGTPDNTFTDGTIPADSAEEPAEEGVEGSVQGENQVDLAEETQGEIPAEEPEAEKPAEEAVEEAVEEIIEENPETTYTPEELQDLIEIEVEE